MDHDQSSSISDVASFLLFLVLEEVGLVFDFVSAFDFAFGFATGF